MFAFHKDVARGPAAQEEILAATLDGDVYDATAMGFPDLRVFVAQAKETPYRLQQATEDRTQTVRQSRDIGILDLKETKGNRIELLLGQKKKRPVNGLVFVTPLRDYERRVTVLGSDDRTAWSPLVSDALLFDYSRYVDLRNGQVVLPPNDYRYFKVVIEEVTDVEQSPLTQLTRQYRGDEEQDRVERTTVRRRPLRIDRIECYENVAQTLSRQGKKVEYPVRFDPKKDATEDAKRKQTILEVGSRREPLTGFTLATPDANFSRAVSVLVPVEKGVTTDWVEAGRGTIEVVRFRGFERKSLKITFPQRRERRYRIVIENRDDQPLKVAGVSAEGDVYQAVFFAAPKGAYRAYYGAESAAAPDYDTTALDATLAKGYEPAAATLGPQSDNPRFGGDSREGLRKVLGSPWFLGVAIGLMVVVLALILFRAGRRIDDLPSE